MKILSFKKFIHEGVRKAEDGYAFDFHSDNDGEIMSLKFLNTKSKQMRSGDTLYKYYYCYEFDNSNDRDLLKKLKSFDASVQAHDIDLFVSKGVQGLDAANPLNEFDSIVYPKSSSKLLNEFAARCAKKSGVAELIPDAFVKSTIDDITFDTNAIERVGNEKTRKQIYKAIDHIKDSGYLVMKEIFAPYRKFVKDFMLFNKAEDRHVFNLVHRKKVLLIDDYRTTGTTLKEMMKQLLKLDPKEVIICVILKVE